MDGRIASRQWWEWLAGDMEKMGGGEEKNGENGPFANVLLGEENKKKEKWGRKSGGSRRGVVFG